MAIGKSAPVSGPDQRTKHRSPSYPSISLKDAIERARRIYQAEHRGGCYRDTAIKHMGYNSAHGQSLTALASLKKYGLYEEKDGRLVPTDRAIDIFVRLEEDPRYIAAVRAAALQPVIYNQLLRSYQKRGTIPSDSQFAAELEADLKFNPRAISDFIADFKATLEYAGLLQGNRITSTIEEPENSQEDEDDTPEENLGGRRERMNPPATPAGAVCLTTLLPGGRRMATLYVPEETTDDDFAYLEDWIRLQRRVHAKPGSRSGSGANGHLEKRAIWRSPDGEREVIVVGEQTGPDGRRYVSVKGSAEDVPACDVSYVTES